MHINDAVFLEDYVLSSDLDNGENLFIDLQEKVVYIAENHLSLLTMYYHVAKVA